MAIKGLKPMENIITQNKDLYVILPQSMMMIWDFCYAICCFQSFLEQSKIHVLGASVHADLKTKISSTNRSLRSRQIIKLNTNQVWKLAHKVHIHFRVYILHKLRTMLPPNFCFIVSHLKQCGQFYLHVGPQLWLWFQC